MNPAFPEEGSEERIAEMVDYLQGSQIHIENWEWSDRGGQMGWAISGDLVYCWTFLLHAVFHQQS